MSKLETRYQTVLNNIEKAAIKSGRKKEDITLVAVTKETGMQEIEQAVALGMQDVGENRAQQLQQRAHLLNKEVNWHFIGQLQSNKVKYIIDSVYLVHSLDRPSLADELHRMASRENRLIQVLIQLNLHDLSHRGGVTSLEDCLKLIEYCQKLSALSVRGLMYMAPLECSQDETRAYFAQVKDIFDNVKKQTSKTTTIDILSMGMSNDYQTAIEEGATMVRVGSALFKE